ncbi:MAG: histidine phosphatase family protein [Candidatus Margulisiibacteriota bacterium]
MPAKLFLLRHGETHSNVAQIYQGHGDSPLTENGLLMTEELAAYLKDECFAGIYCSDLCRGQETAKIVSQYHAVCPTVMPDLRERNYGIWEDMAFDEIEKQFPKQYQIWLNDPVHAIIPAAEPLPDLQRRAILAIKHILEQHPAPADNVCVVGHGGINRTILFHFMGLDLNNFWKIRQSNCCINIIEFGVRPVVALINNTCHIKQAAVDKIPVY